MTLSFDQLPSEVSALRREILALKSLILSQQPAEAEDLPEFLDIDQLRAYLPSKPARQTVYGLVSAKKIPFHKFNGKLFFSRQEIDAWIATKRHKTQIEINEEAREFIAKRKGGR